MTGVMRTVGDALFTGGPRWRPHTPSAQVQGRATSSMARQAITWIASGSDPIFASPFLPRALGPSGSSLVRLTRRHRGRRRRRMPSERSRRRSPSAVACRSIARRTQVGATRFGHGQSLSARPAGRVRTFPSARRVRTAEQRTDAHRRTGGDRCTARGRSRRTKFDAVTAMSPPTPAGLPLQPRHITSPGAEPWA